MKWATAQACPLPVLSLCVCHPVAVPALCALCGGPRWAPGTADTRAAAPAPGRRRAPGRRPGAAPRGDVRTLWQAVGGAGRRPPGPFLGPSFTSATLARLSVWGLGTGALYKWWI